ncbi:MAG: hypothetical protein HC913_18695 [Microscillaceae bacterium]|nr:hypothetical protein [Microscillaceae bacterium]
MHNLEANLVLKSIEKIATAFKDSELNEAKKRKLLNGLKEEVKTVGSFYIATKTKSGYSR